LNSREKILQILLDKDGVSAKALRDILGISKQRVHKILKELIADKRIFKIGSPPRVLYYISDPVIKNELDIDEETKEQLQENFILISPRGDLLEGVEAFSAWYEGRNLPIKKTIDEYKKTQTKYIRHVNKDGLIDGIQKLKNTKELSLCVDQQFYVDFYAIERFGKTKLGTFMHFGKMSQSKKLIKMIINISKPKLEKAIQMLKVDAIAYVPPSLKRDIQIMRELENGFHISLPIIKLEKIKGDIIIPQKALPKIKDRIENARNSITVNDNRNFKRVLLIDDALGSGATINEVACKLKKRKIASKVFGFAITGSYKGFEVISEA